LSIPRENACVSERASSFGSAFPLDGAPALPASDGVELSVVPGLCLVQLFAKNGKTSKVCKRLDISGKPGRATVNKEFTALPLSPGQWMLLAKESRHRGGLAAHVADRLEGRGYVSEQSDSRVCVRVRGPMARRVMAKGCRLDLHPTVAGPGFCAQTVMAQVGVLLHQVDDTPTYDLLVYSGFARSFWDWMREAAAEFAA
jgi:heterotetrameric sarcosine oxidase gamma subunit